MSENPTVKNSCSFCMKEDYQVDKLIKGPSDDIYICNECIKLCNSVLGGTKSDSSTGSSIEKAPIGKPKVNMKPMDIYKHLNDFIIGQDEAKKTLSVSVYNHYKKINNEIDGDITLDKSNILLVGPTGTGKTLLAKTLAKILDVPFTIADATTLTESGYVGADAESILSSLYQSANQDMDLAEKGIIYIDEIDKISRKSENPSLTRDVSGEGVQQALLKLLEGTKVNITPQGGRRHPQQDGIEFNTERVLFICGGSFEGMTKKNEIGFNSKKVEKDSEIKKIVPEDLRKFGLIPELIGRLPVIVQLNLLDESDLIRVLTEPKNSLYNQYKTLFELDNMSLKLEPDTLPAIARETLKRKTGARGLRSIMEDILTEVMFEAPSRSDILGVTIPAEAVSDKSKVRWIKKVMKEKKTINE
ncbi:MAG: ATP-dependent Clp protease ATP-binding subunit ClpX [Alphaproteobacteria bacterium]|nr:ATP-dependent Clp protease ATP-binding subunit ClpX [Alphaproteobacteria bacterium]MBL0717832.1 ATP-dependent Clp protease ATP-binding subunit ClpX [Alphaproteobacteria bacterium]